jgi:hypothetical protein
LPPASGYEQSQPRWLCGLAARLLLAEALEEMEATAQRSRFRVCLIATATVLELAPIGSWHALVVPITCLQSVRPSAPC